MHKFVNSNPAGFDSNCAVCGGKDRDAIHRPSRSRYAHWGAGSTLAPLPEGQRREEAIADGLRKLAKRCGITLREPLNIDAAGEISLIACGPAKRIGCNEPCGQYGEQFAALISKHGSRTGAFRYGYHNHRAASDGWCMMNHFAVQAMLEDAESINPQFTTK